MRKFFWTFLGIAIAPALFCSSVVAGDAKIKDGHGAEPHRVASTSQVLQDPLSGREEAAAAGRKLYKTHCAQCHGSQARGQDQAPGLRSASIQNAPPENLFSILRNGRIRRGMPSWSRLPNQQLWQIVAYLKTLQESE